MISVKILRQVCGVILAIFLLVSCDGVPAGISVPVDSSNGNGARTFYESLNLETPEDAVRTFLTAFQRQDFMTVYLVFFSETQWNIGRQFASTFSYSHLVGSETNEQLDLSISKAITIQKDYWYVFDQIMLAAAQNDDLLIDLSGDFAILDKEEIDAQTVDVVTSVEGVRGEVVFRLVRDLDNRWRIYIVAAPEELLETWPFSIPTGP